MELDLRRLDKHERETGEESPPGLILCESAGAERVELVQFGAGGVRSRWRLPPGPMTARG